MQIGCPTKCSFFSLGIIDGDDDDDGLLSVSWWWYAAQFSAVVPFPNTSLSLAPDLLHKIFALLPTKRGYPISVGGGDGGDHHLHSMTHSDTCFILFA